MNKLDFNIKAGWPGSTETWEFLQNMILQAQSGAAIGGKYWIVSGCVESAGNVTNGVVCIDGELLPFVGGPVQSNVIISDNVTNRAFFGGASNPYYHERTATFGSGTGAVAWSAFKRNDPDRGVLARLDKVEKMLKPLLGYEVSGTTYYGSWLFWGRPAAEIPVGWEPVPDADWKGKVPVVMNVSDADFDTVGKTGGEKTHQLTVAELPSHNHSISRGDAYTGNAYQADMRVGGGQGANPQSSPNTGNTGGNAAHNNLQPYKVVMFIRFVG